LKENVAMQITAHWGFILSTCTIAASQAMAAPFSPDQAPGRLPKNAFPESYTIDIVPNVATMSLTGTETIVLHVREATDTIQFNSLNEILRDVRFDGHPVKQVVSNDKAQLTTVALASRAAVGSHTLSFAYSGKIEERPVGLFAQKYLDPSGAKRTLLSTQMEATDARRMFPCWDEPAFRATFKLTATVAADWAAIGNMPVAKRVVHGKLATTTFETTPKMPSYLVEFTAGDMARISATAGGTEFGVWAVRGLEKNGTTALANAQAILADYDEYFGYKFPLPKLDSIAIPGGFTGAMENWGAITYNDQTLLLSASSSIGNRQDVYSTQAHEMAHQWNGDLVTMAWWDDIWLNESFASWMAAKETAARNPDWKWSEDQDKDKESAMSADALPTSHAIQQHVTDELQANNAFDPQITYSKGQAILRMFEAYLGNDVFRTGIRAYIKEFAFSNATTHDMWRALSSSSGKDVGAIASGWTEQAGFPLVSVTAGCDSAGARTLSLSQKRFLLRGSVADDVSWKIPLQIRSGVDAAPQGLLLAEKSQSASAGRCDEPLSLNAGDLGFYRSRYDAATLAINTKNFGQMKDSDRIALLDDQWALVESGVDPLPTYLALASSMGSDLDTTAWTQIVVALETIDFAERGSVGHEAFALYARSILQPPFEKLGWIAKAGETPDVQLLRRTIIRELGTLGDPAVISEARKRFAAFLGDRGSISPDDQGVIMNIVAQHADAATFEQVHAVARASKDETEMRRYYIAMMSVQDPILAQQAAQVALSTEISPQADSLRLQLIRRLAFEHPQLAWQVFRDNSDRLLKPFGGNAPLVAAVYMPEAFWKKVPLAEIDTWVRAHVPSEMNSFIDAGMETARFRLAEKDMLIAATSQYLSSRR
jgi:aminopeptidase N